MSGVRQEFERLASVLQDSVFNVAVHLSGNVEDGISLAREAFVRAYGAYAGGCRPPAFRPWVYKLLFDIHQRRASLHAAPPAWMLSPGVNSEGALDYHLTALDNAPIDQALGCLPVQLRMPFILCDIEGLSYAEAGRILRQPKVHVAQSLFQARFRLRTLIRESKSRRPQIER